MYRRTGILAANPKNRCWDGVNLTAGWVRTRGPGSARRGGEGKDGRGGGERGRMRSNGLATAWTPTPVPSEYPSRAQAPPWICPNRCARNLRGGARRLCVRGRRPRGLSCEWVVRLHEWPVRLLSMKRERCWTCAWVMRWVRRSCLQIL